MANARHPHVRGRGSPVLERVSHRVTLWTGSSWAFGDLSHGVPHPACADKDAAALHLKLNEIVAALQGASNRLINVENLSEKEVQTLHLHYQRLIALARRDADLQQSRSIEEAEARHDVTQRRAPCS
ncbi:MAG: low affinity iron permease family protein [Candidatus Rokuibacteriota bacterium]